MVLLETFHKCNIKITYLIEFLFFILFVTQHVKKHLWSLMPSIALAQIWLLFILYCIGVLLTVSGHISHAKY